MPFVTNGDVTAYADRLLVPFLKRYGWTETRNATLDDCDFVTISNKLLDFHVLLIEYYSARNSMEQELRRYTRRIGVNRGAGKGGNVPSPISTYIEQSMLDDKSKQ